MFVDMPEEELRRYTSSQVDPVDFDEFWAATLDSTRSHDLGLAVVPVDTGLATVDVFDVTFAGYEGQPVRAWLRVPHGASAPLPAVVQFVGYGGGRGRAVENLFWSSAGYAHLQMDTRGQGSAWSEGATADPDGGGPQFPGFLTRGIDSRETYYYRRVFADAVRAVEAARTLPAIDADRVVVLGGSQGGGIALAVAGLVPGLAAAFPRVPFLCDFPRATVMTDADPYKEIGRYLAVHRDRVDAVHGVLAYFDGVNFARRATAPAWFTTALMDPICPPSTVFGAFNVYGGEKAITVWPYNGHEGGDVFDDEAQLAVLRQVLPV
ncbi:cephalosporin-C deacetylase [Frondihabitans sp. PhB188]|uniref:acetylxylan esterase n=1 Tax=Frondihabitans sp. PhB188 TaxID=2485200 RepID=UPI000F49867F|nr:acetylxylan esterase [Frondihabitans sp. PhB188]ROQ39667.1 cephalosporin-C deacetylase [Frondihabitans sp. PhB188]